MIVFKYILLILIYSINILSSLMEYSKIQLLLLLKYFITLKIVRYDFENCGWFYAKSYLFINILENLSFDILLFDNELLV